MKISSWLIIGLVALVALTGIVAIANISLNSHYYLFSSDSIPTGNSFAAFTTSSGSSPTIWQRLFHQPDYLQLQDRNRNPFFRQALLR